MTRPMYDMYECRQITLNFTCPARGGLWGKRVHIIHIVHTAVRNARNQSSIPCVVWAALLSPERVLTINRPNRLILIHFLLQRKIEVTILYMTYQQVTHAKHTAPAPVRCTSLRDTRAQARCASYARGHAHCAVAPQIAAHCATTQAPVRGFINTFVYEMGVRHVG